MVAGGEGSRFAGRVLVPGEREKGGIAASEVRGQLLFGLLAGHEADLKLKKKFLFKFNP